MIKIHEKIQTKKQIKIYRVIAMWFDLGTLVIPVAMETFALKWQMWDIYTKRTWNKYKYKYKDKHSWDWQKVKLPLEIQPSSFLQIPTQLKTHKVQQGSRGDTLWQ